MKLKNYIININLNFCNKQKISKSKTPTLPTLEERDIVLSDFLHFPYRILPHQVIFVILEQKHFIC